MLFSPTYRQVIGLSSIPPLSKASGLCVYLPSMGNTLHPYCNTFQAYFSVKFKILILKSIQFLSISFVHLLSHVILFSRLNSHICCRMASSNTNYIFSSFLHVLQFLVSLCFINIIISSYRLINCIITYL